MTTQISSRIFINSLAALGSTITVIAYKINKDRCYAHNPCPHTQAEHTCQDTSVPSTGIKWINNWDEREPKPRDPASGPCGCNREERPSAKRNIFLIRHGDYDMFGRLANLNPQGIVQSEFTGERLSDLGHKYDIILHSTMRRAMETADIIRKYIPQTMMTSSPLLREGAPIKSEPLTSYRPPSEQIKCDGERIEKAFRVHFHRADAWKKEDTFEIMICHANVIRYFVCRAMQFPPEAWLRFGLCNCSITWLIIHPNGRVELKSLGDSAAVGCISTIVTNNGRFSVEAEISDEEKYPFPAPPKSSTPWDHNWDNREPRPFAASEILVKDMGSSGDYCEIDPKTIKAPIAKRNIFLIRHGHYKRSNGQLSEAGKMQALLTAERLNKLGYWYNTTVFTSTMIRAKQTTQLIQMVIPRLKIKEIDKISEGCPCLPDPLPGHKIESDGERIEKAFTKYFHRADHRQTKDSYELVVIHGNVIRYFVCRALQFTPDAWTRFTLNNCSITWLVIHPNGRVELKAMGDAEHLPPELITTA
uniref:Serine/threonine-protein phosphatase PGAM5, mitochondrial n=1 Tax=Strigamia maritima TaxID=126957 RepID=T1J2W9_STRMM